jgi:hypothetical protein
METSPVIRRKTKLLLLTTIFMICSGCASVLRIDGPYEGRVIDAETGKPIEGVVAHGTWSRIHPNPAGRSTEYYDSYEVLTNKDGEFKIPGKGLLVFSNIDDMTLTIFKAGYEQWHPNSWSGVRNWKSDDSLVWDEFGKGTFKLRRMTMEERRNTGVSMPLGPKHKKKLLIRERNKEMLEKGRPASSLIPEE